MSSRRLVSISPGQTPLTRIPYCPSSPEYGRQAVDGQLELYAAVPTRAGGHQCRDVDDGAAALASIMRRAKAWHM
jgi:hypothetical protein